MRSITFQSFLAGLLLVTLSASLHAQGNSVSSVVKWSGTSGTLPASPSTGDAYASAVENIGDLDGDGIDDVVVGLAGLISLDGKLWVQFLNADGSVREHVEITEGVGGFTGSLDVYDRFGRSIANLGDLDGDGITDLAVSAHGDDDGASASGAIYILFMNADGTVSSEQKISSTQGGFSGSLDNTDAFGAGLACLDDLDGDGVQDLLAAAPFDDDGGVDAGALYVLFLNTDGTVKSTTKISSTLGIFFGQLEAGDFFGLDALVSLGDMDGDGLLEVAVGAAGDNDGGTDRGAVWILELFPNGLVADFSSISSTSGGFNGKLQDTDNFGSALDVVGDLNGDGVLDLVVGANGDTGLGANDRGAVWLLFMNSDGSVLGKDEISDGKSGFTAVLDDNDYLGVDVAVIGDLDGNGLNEIVVGAFADDDGGTDAGAAYVLFLQPCSVSATATSRNAGTNPASFVADPPVLGELWTATVDLSSTGHSLALVIGFDASIQFGLPGGQTLLAINGFGAGELLGLPLQVGPLASFQLQLPVDPSFCGLTVYTQAAHIGGVMPFALSNAMDLVLGI